MIPKFRAWDKEIEEMVDWDTIIGYWDFSHLFSETEEGSYFGTGGFIAMQYTGLKDENGVDIFEGDIIEWVDEIIDFDTRKYKDIVRHSPVSFLHGAYIVEGNPLYFLETEEAEVIGNIYENPELL